MSKTRFVRGLFVFRSYVCDQNAPSSSGTIVYAETLKELKKAMKDEFEESFGSDDEEDKVELEFKDDCRFSDYEIGNGNDFILVDIAHLPNGIGLIKKGMARVPCTVCGKLIDVAKKDAGGAVACSASCAEKL